MTSAFIAHLQSEIAGLKSAGLYKSERVITSKQAGEIAVASGERVLNFCANNYLGLADNEELAEAGRKALDRYGYGMASVRFICGTQDIHKTLEQRIARFLGTEDTILYAAAFDANGGLFEPLLTEQDAIISDELNHASIIDGIRLCKAKRFRYKHNDLADLEVQLQAAQAAGARFILVFTDGVFSMDGTIAQLDKIREITNRYGALLGIDECHASGFLGSTGRGTHEHRGVFGQVDIITGTLGKALGGASGGFTTGRKEVIELLRQRSRPYLFSNTLAPVIAAASLKVFDLIDNGDALRQRLYANADLFRAEMTKLGFTLAGEGHPIIPVMLGDASLAQEMASRMLARGVYVIGFSFPVVPRGQARIRTQMSAAHSEADVRKAIQVFAEVGRELGVI
ncbi:UNVERIFIED_ORG: glycine C-acetyltransferase [Roseateles sp. XES5]|nr:glycine C-acetyltransferase [Roseateles sp. XES5]